MLSPSEFHDTYPNASHSSFSMNKGDFIWFKKHILKGVKLLSPKDPLPCNKEIALASRVYGSEIIKICITNDKIYVQKGKDIYIKENTSAIKKHFLKETNSLKDFFW